MLRNGLDLKKLFQSESFFPALEYSTASELITRCLYDKVSSTVLPVINGFVEKTDLSVLDRLSESGIVEESFRKLKLHDFLKSMLSNRDARYNFNCAYNIIVHSVAERYIKAIYTGGYFDSELRSEYGSPTAACEYIVYIKIAAIIRSIVHVPHKINKVDPERELTISDIPRSRKNMELFTARLVNHIHPILPGIPEKILYIAVRSNMPSTVTLESDFSSRLLYILAGRFQNYKHTGKDESGAESPDKSWFDVSLKNAEFFGFDSRILEVLKTVAGENNW